MRLEAARLSTDVSQFLGSSTGSGRRLQGSVQGIPLESVAARAITPDSSHSSSNGGGTGNDTIVFIEDPSLAQTSPTISLIKRQTAVVKAALTVVEGEWWTIEEYLPARLA
jgi:hypothetical protein